VTYGPFPENKKGEPLPEPEQAEEDFARMKDAGINALRVYHVPPRWMLDLAAQKGLYVLAGIPWPQHLCFLDQYEVCEAIKREVRKAARRHRGHSALLAWFIGNEIPSHIVRWHGLARVEKFLAELCAIIRAEDPDVLVTYANYPSTEYLELPFLDFLSFNLYLHDETSFSAYVKRLQNKAGALPLVLSELGMDSQRQGEEGQAAFLDWQLTRAFALGVSGTVAFAWTDEWATGGQTVADWAFGMVRADRTPKPAYEAAARAFSQPLPPLPPSLPFISVVVCAYNAEATLPGCLASLAQLNYPKFEVIVVDDGSTDATGLLADAHAARFARFRVLHQPNLGLSAARNAGLHASAGTGSDLVAYTDADCEVDPHWLHYLALAMADNRFAAVGGPNLPPPEDNLTAACVAVSPGAPAHVLLSDDVAEHIPGCNMAFRKERLCEIGGFDPLYRVAGDDVDVCWRLQERGQRIGFAAAMCVWHHRRNTIRAYCKQQRGYGRAEALLIPKHTRRFNRLGDSRWQGHIYGDSSYYFLGRRFVIYHGPFGLGLFQTLYRPLYSPAACLPLCLEWMLLSLLVMIAAIGMPPAGLLGLAMLATTLALALLRAGQARLPKKHERARARIIIAALILTQPVLRSLTRYWTLWGLYRKGKFRLQAQGQTTGRASRPKAPMPKPGRLSPAGDFGGVLFRRLTVQRFFWQHGRWEREAALARTMAWLNRRGLAYTQDSGFATSRSLVPWDFKITPGDGMQCHLRLTIEDHGGAKRFVRLAGTFFPTWPALAGFVLTGGGALALLPVSAPASAVLACVAAALALRAACAAYRGVSLLADLTESLQRWIPSNDF